MEKFTKFVAFALMLLLTHTFAACSDDDEKLDTGLIIGSWELIGNYSVEKEDGVVVEEVTNDPNDVGSVSTFSAYATVTTVYSDGSEDVMDWRIDGNQLYISDAETGLSQTFTISTLTLDELVLESEYTYVDDDGVSCYKYEKAYMNRK